MNFPDGVPITWVQHRSGAPGAERVCGIDLMPLVFELGQEMGLRHYLLGSTDRVLGELQRQITGKWPRAVIGGACSPPFGPIGAHKRAGVLEAISKAAPHLVWVGLGAPKQDLWGQAYASDINPSLALGVGAAFDFVAQTKDRAPIWMRERGLEWFYRLSREPRRLLGRYAQSNTEFILRLGCDYARRTTHRRDDQAHFSQAQHRSADDRDRDEGADYEQ
jgi:N-acetylglucosaminyldiphosphoundecaprenol N-acetyl-beta-D-mannosaminyltransferase